MSKTFNYSIETKNRVIFVDGAVGGGKTLASNIVGSVKNIDWWNYDSKYEQICSLHYSKILKKEQAAYLIKKFYNEQFFDNFILRNVNTRDFDLSNIKNSPRYSEILKRFKINDHKAKSIYKKTKIKMNFMTHFNSLASEPLFSAFQKKLVYIYLMRSPVNLYSFNHLTNWIKEWKKTIGRFSMLTFQDPKKKTNYPYFVEKIKKKFINANKFEQTILALNIVANHKKNISLLQKYKKKYNSNLIIIPYEKLTSEPMSFIDKVLNLTGEKKDKILLETIKKNKLPRKPNFIPKKIKGYEIYKERFKKNNSLDESADTFEFLVKKKVSKSNLMILTKLKNDYIKILKKYD